MVKNKDAFRILSSIAFDIETIFFIFKYFDILKT